MHSYVITFTSPLCLLLREVSLCEALHHSAITTGLLLLVLNVLPFRRQEIERESARAGPEQEARTRGESQHTVQSIGLGGPKPSARAKDTGALLRRCVFPCRSDLPVRVDLERLLRFPRGWPAVGVPVSKGRRLVPRASRQVDLPRVLPHGVQELRRRTEEEGRDASESGSCGERRACLAVSFRAREHECAATQRTFACFGSLASTRFSKLARMSSTGSAGSMAPSLPRGQTALSLSFLASPRARTLFFEAFSNKRYRPEKKGGWRGREGS